MQFWRDVMWRRAHERVQLFRQKHRSMSVVTLHFGPKPPIEIWRLKHCRCVFTSHSFTTPSSWNCAFVDIWEGCKSLWEHVDKAVDLAKVVYICMSNYAAWLFRSCRPMHSRPYVYLVFRVSSFPRKNSSHYFSRCCHMKQVKLVQCGELYYGGETFVWFLVVYSDAVCRKRFARQRNWSQVHVDAG